MPRALDLAPIDAIDSYAWAGRFELYRTLRATQARLEPGEPTLLLTHESSAEIEAIGPGELLGLLELAFGEEVAQQLWEGQLAGRRAKWCDATIDASQAAGGGSVVVLVDFG